MKPCVGTSGFGVARAKYVEVFSCVEVQHTFYQPPQISTLQRWRETAPPDFEFVLKAWQLITHDAKSPTYRRLKRKLSEAEKEEAGYFRPTTIVKEAWQATLESARALQARTVLFQCPASFKATKENIVNIRTFFKAISKETKKEKINFCWEPRGDWDRDVVKNLCSELNLWHVVDPFISKTVTPGKLYFRLHGKGGWRYEYEDSELLELAVMFGENDPKTKLNSYVFFNNVRMTQDALRLKAITGLT
ncbi:MAG TPA: DUF72 domain-containing protein [Pyrinomonadaceae bacterium]|nr:DUF72 domain-containing protein [Pyrinomonadaceae bacterium]